jgi:hypothetical protein
MLVATVGDFLSWVRYIERKRKINNRWNAIKKIFLGGTWVELAIGHLGNAERKWKTENQLETLDNFQFVLNYLFNQQVRNAWINCYLLVNRLKTIINRYKVSVWIARAVHYCERSQSQLENMQIQMYLQIPGIRDRNDRVSLYKWRRIAKQKNCIPSLQRTAHSLPIWHTLSRSSL